jgi:hypothetical protein
MKKIVEKGNSYAAGEIARIERLLGKTCAFPATAVCFRLLAYAVDVGS